MKKTLLIIVNTPFQMITAIQLASTEYKGYLVDVIITDNIAQYTELAKRVLKSKIFSNVYAVKTKGLKWNNWKYTLFPFVYGNRIFKIMPFIYEKKYEVVLFANTGGVSACIATFFNSRYGSVLGMYEDGFVSYSKFYYDEIKDAFIL